MQKKLLIVTELCRITHWSGCSAIGSLQLTELVVSHPPELHQEGLR